VGKGQKKNQEKPTLLIGYQEAKGL